MVGMALAVATLVPPILPPLSGLPGLHGDPGHPEQPHREAPAPPPRPSRSPPSRCSGTSGRGTVAYKDAVFPCDFSDPMVLRVRDGWYAYATAAGWEHGVRTFPILHSTDLRHWHFVGDALPKPPAWTSGDLWGPTVLRWRGRYLMYFGALNGKHGVHCLDVATAPDPAGPFVAGRRIGCRSRYGAGYIDPSPLVRHGRLYLFFSVDSPRHAICATRLSPDGLRAVGRTKTVLPVSSRWGRLDARTVEGPSPLYRRGLYYLFYSAGSWSADYRMAYAVARSPLGPYRDRAPVPILHGGGGLRSPGGGAVVTGSNGPTWLAFHAWNGKPGYQNRGSERTLRIAPLLWDRRGRPRLDLAGAG